MGPGKTKFGETRSEKHYTRLNEWRQEKSQNYTCQNK